MSAVSDTTAARVDEIVDSLRIAMHASPDGAFVLDRNGCVLMANAALCTSLGVGELELIGRHFDVASRSDDPHQISEGFRTALEGTASRYRGSGTRTDGQAFVVEVTQLPIRLDGHVAAVLGTAVDLTDVDRHDVETRQSEDLLKLAGRIARFGGWAVDAATQEVTLSKSTRDMLGIPDDEPDVGAMAWGMHPDDDRRHIEQLLERCLATGDAFDTESIMVSNFGERLTMRTIGEADRSPNGTIIGAHGAIWDITEVVAARERERALESRLSATLNAITDGILFLDNDFRVTYANAQAVEMSPHNRHELLGGTITELFPEGDDAGFHASFERARATGGRVVHRAHVAAVDRWFETTAYPAAQGLAMYVRDVTEEERARETARRSQEQLAEQGGLLDIARDAMIVRDLNNRVRYWNAAAATLYGWTADEVVGRWIGDLIYADTIELDRATEHVMREGFFTGEMQHRTRDGRILVVDCRWQLLRDDQGNPTSIFIVNSDITDFRREQELRVRAQRMESLGTLAGGIAHDLNNVLTPILMSVQLLEHDERDPSRRELLTSMESAVKRGAEMIGQVLSFARGVEGRRIPVDVDRLVDDLVSFSRDALPSDVVLEIERDARLPVTVGDPTQLLQVLINLVTNARDAMGGRGRLRVTAAPCEIADHYTSVSHSAPTGAYIAITIEDDGHGMSADVVSKIFEPFFTTKSPGKGTGLGLATSLAIIRSHHGFIQAYSEPGGGTRFIVGLPVSNEPLPVAASSAPTMAPLPRGSGELVLVIDDEETIRHVTSRTLEAHGYRTALASNGREAIDLIESGGNRIDLVLTDMMMPVMDGAATSAYLEEHHPSIPIIAASGLNSGASGSRTVGMGISRFLAKPYTTRVLLTAVSETLLEHQSIGRDAE